MVPAMVPMIPGRPGWTITQVENQEGMGGGEEKEEGKACTGRLRNHPLHPAVLSEVFYGSPSGAAAGGPVPL